MQTTKSEACETSNKKLVAQLEGIELDYWVAKALGYKVVRHRKGFFVTNDDGDPAGIIADDVAYCHNRLSWSTSWAQGGQILDDEDISIIKTDDDDFDVEPYAAATGKARRRNLPDGCGYGSFYEFFLDKLMYGKTPLIAGMRAFVALKFGEYVEDIAA